MIPSRHHAFSCLLVALLSWGGVLAQSAPPAAVMPELPAALTAPGWEAAFGSTPGVGLNSTAPAEVSCMAVFDDGLGDGPVLFVGGYFDTAGGQPALNIARWDGSTWSALADGVQGRVHSMAVHDDGTGEQLYVGGAFTGAGVVPGTAYLARWNGTAWSAASAGVNGTVRVVYRFTDGASEILSIGGDFTLADGVPASRAAISLGGSWVPFGDGFNQSVRAYALHDNEVYAGGSFTASGATSVSRLARWTGSSWEDVDGGANGTVYDLESWAPSGAPALYVAGSFSSVGSSPTVPVSGFARWQAGSWSAPGGGAGPIVRDLEPYDDGGGEDLYLTGTITTSGGSATAGQHVLRFDGSTLATVGGGLENVGQALVAHDDGSGASLWAGGSFVMAGGVGADGVARWDGSTWHGTGLGLNDTVLAVHASTSFLGGPTLFVGGQFAVPGTTGDRALGAWQAGGWVPMGAITDDDFGVASITEFDDGGGVDLYVGGSFSSIGGVAADNIARWDGSTWSDVGGGLGGFCLGLRVHDDGSGPALYAVGEFASAGGSPAAQVARWDGSTWSALGAGIPGAVYDLISFDDGGGADLYVVGIFNVAGGVPAAGIARWDGAAWSALGTGLTCCGGSSPGAAIALAEYDDGGGPALYVGGVFTGAGGVPDTSGIARWDGSAWSALAGTPDQVHALAVFDAGSGKSLYAGGDFVGIGASTSSRVARWDGATWSSLGSGVGDNRVDALTVFDDGSGFGPRLVVGGSFTQIGDTLPDGASHLAYWNGDWDGVSAWTDLGFALPGGLGDPLLEGTGSLAFGSFNQVSLSNAAPSALAGLFLSFASTPTPFAGGTLVPVPWIDPPIILALPASGGLTLDVPMDVCLPPGITLYLQWVIQDVTAVAGKSMSNAIVGVTP